MFLLKYFAVCIDSLVDDYKTNAVDELILVQVSRTWRSHL